jgi:hypothetical protein
VDSNSYWTQISGRILSYCTETFDSKKISNENVWDCRNNPVSYSSSQKQFHCAQQRCSVSFYCRRRPAGRVACVAESSMPQLETPLLGFSTASLTSCQWPTLQVCFGTLGWMCGQPVGWAVSLLQQTTPPQGNSFSPPLYKSSGPSERPEEKFP